MRAVSVARLVDSHARRLGLSWIAGRAAAARQVSAEGLRTAPGAGGGIAASRSLVGYLNLIHPNQVQVLGASELAYLAGLREASRRDTVAQLVAQQPACVVVAEGLPAPPELVAACEREGVALLGSALAGDKLVDDLYYYLTHLLAEVVTMHGVYMEVAAIGVLLAGPPGVGKSELALELITRGHRLVADDAPQFSRVGPDIINGTCPPALADFLEVRGIGVLNVRQLFGDGAVKANKYLRLIVALEPLRPGAINEVKRLEGSYRSRRILDVDIPEITLPVAPGRNLAVLVECAARNHILRMSGYSSTEDFARRQARMVEEDAAP